MATFTTAAIISQSRTPESVVWRVDNNPPGADAPTLLVLRAAVLAALLSGPLYERLRKTPDWTVFNVPAGSQASYIRWTLVDGGLDVTLQPPLTSATVFFHADSIEFSLAYFSNDAYQACGLMVEMRAEHSNER